MVLSFVDVVERFALKSDDLPSLLFQRLLCLHRVGFRPDEFSTSYRVQSMIPVVVDVQIAPLTLSHRNQILVGHHDREGIFLRLQPPLTPTLTSMKQLRSHPINTNPSMPGKLASFGSDSFPTMIGYACCPFSSATRISRLNIS